MPQNLPHHDRSTCPFSRPPESGWGWHAGCSCSHGRQRGTAGPFASYRKQADILSIDPVGALKTLGERIRYFRERKGWGQPDLARATGIRQDRISKIENNNRKAYFWEVERLALCLEVPLGWMDTVRHQLQREKPVPPAQEEKRVAVKPAKRPPTDRPTGPVAGAV